MSNKNNINLNFFKKKDLILYGVILLIFVILFCSLILPQNKKMTGILIEVDNQKVLTYSFNEDKFNIKQEWEDSSLSVHKTETGYYIYFTLPNDKSSFNYIDINVKNKTAKITDANCPHLDCVFTKRISKAGQSIYCAAHGLKVKALGNISNDISLG